MTPLETVEFVSSDTSASSGNDSNFVDVNESRSVQVQTFVATDEASSQTTPTSQITFVNLSVSGTNFSVPVSLILAHEWKLADVVQGKQSTPDHNGRIYVDEDPQSFRWVLFYLRRKRLPKALLSEQLEIESLRDLAENLCFKDLVSYVDGQGRDVGDQKDENQQYVTHETRLREEIEELKTKLSFQTDKTSQLKTEMHHLQSEEVTTASLGKEVNELKNQVVSLKNEVNTLKGFHTHKADTNEVKMETMMKDINKLQNQITILQKENDGLKAVSAPAEDAAEEARLQRKKCIDYIKFCGDTAKSAMEMRQFRRCLADIIVSASRGEVSMLEMAYVALGKSLSFQVLCLAFVGSDETSKTFAV